MTRSRRLALDVAEGAVYHAAFTAAALAALTAWARRCAARGGRA